MLVVMTRLLLAVTLVLALGDVALGDDDEPGPGPRNKLTGPPRGHPQVWGKPSDELRRQASRLRMRAMDNRDAADDLRARGRGSRADELDDQADDFEDRAHAIDQRADMMDERGEDANRGMVLPAPNPALP